jgi:hypothetical protein
MGESRVQRCAWFAGQMNRWVRYDWAVLPGDVAVDFWLRPILPEDMPGLAAQLLPRDTTRLGSAWWPVVP